MHGFSLVAVVGGCPLVSVCGLLFAVVSLVVEHGLSCTVACRILVPGSGIEPMSPALQGRFLATGLPGKAFGSLSLAPFLNSIDKFLW